MMRDVDELVARQLVLLRHPVAGVDEVVVVEPLRAEAVRRRDVLHEHAAVARVRLPLALEVVADLERDGQVVAGGDHEPVAEAVQALVLELGERLHLRVVAEPARHPAEDARRAVGDVDERPLEHAVVVARVADRVAFGERAADVALEACERGRTDDVRDAVACVRGRSRPLPRGRRARSSGRRRRRGSRTPARGRPGRRSPRSPSGSARSHPQRGASEASARQPEAARPSRRAPRPSTPQQRPPPG